LQIPGKEDTPEGRCKPRHEEQAAPRPTALD
jgi:hypothetical protein